jgi:adenylate cyclase
MSGEPPTSGDGAPGAGLPPSGGAQPPTSSGPPSHGHGPRIEFRFLDELKRRNVWRVAILYLVVCWLILEPVHVIFHMLEVPAWANRLVIVIMALGFPAVTIFAWVYEITPEGLKPTDDVAPQRSIRLQTGRRLDRAIIAVLSLALAYFVVDKFWLSKHLAAERQTAQVAPVAFSTTSAVTAVSDKSIAVLPFLDMSEKKDQEYFSDGLSEELLNLLSKVPELHVAARTSAFSFKGKSDDIPTIARKLLVAHVLEGSVRKSGNHLRVTAQLVRANNGYHLWSETYDRQLIDVFKVQDEIAGAVVTALKVSLLGGEPPHATTTQDTRAYTLLLQARFIGNRGTDEDFKKCIEYLEQAVRLDPTYAPAWAYLSRTLSAAASEGVIPRQPGRERALRAAERALAIDPKLASAHLAMGKIRLMFDWDWAAADAEIKQARELDPGDSGPLVWAGIFAKVVGRLGDALPLYQQAIALDPVNPRHYVTIARAYYAMGRFSDAASAVRKALELSPAMPGVRGFLGILELHAGAEPAAALAEIDRDTDQENREICRALAYHLLGRKVDADAALARVEETYAASSPYAIAMIHAERREVDQAFHWLDRAYEQHDDFVYELKVDPSLKNLRDDPRYKMFLRKLKLPE